MWFVELAPLSDPTQVPRAVAIAVGVREKPPASLLDALAEHLGGSSALLILDNCEHLITTAAATAHELLRRCEALRILTTSRQALGVEGERVWAVPPLSVPGPEVAIPDECARHDAVALFIDRARLSRADFKLTAENAPVVATICRGLDGL